HADVDDPTIARGLVTPLDQVKLARFRQNHQQVVVSQQLPVAVPIGLPFSFPSLGVEANQHAFIETVDISLIEYRAGEFGLQVAVRPLLLDAPFAVRFRDREQRAADTVTRGNKHAVAFQYEWLGDIDSVLSFPRMTPEFLAGA